MEEITPEDREIEPERSIVIFHLGKEIFAFPTDQIQHVSLAQRIHGLPHQKSHLLKGVVNVDGRLKIALSLHKIFQIEETIGPKSFILIGQPGKDFVFLVDELLGTTVYHSISLQAVSNPLLKGVIPPQLHIIDVQSLFTHLGGLFS